MLVEKSIQIIGGKKLTGTIEVSGAKNAVLKQMILPILSEGVYKINNVPNIADVFGATWRCPIINGWNGCTNTSKAIFVSKR